MKKLVNKMIAILEFEIIHDKQISDSKNYMVKIIFNSLVYINKSKAFLPNIYFLII